MDSIYRVRCKTEESYSKKVLAFLIMDRYSGRMKARWYNFRLLIRSPWAGGSGILGGGAIWSIIQHFTNRAHIRGNLGSTYAGIDLFLDICNSILVGFFIASVVRKWHFFKTPKNTAQYGWVGSFFSLLVTGCPACSITLATYLGIGSILALLPYAGMEIKVL